MELGIRGRRAAVAAASSGLGLASAKALAAEGVHVAICGRHEDTLGAAADEIGHGCIPIVADVSTVEGAAAFVEAAQAALGGIDILVPNGGGPPPGNFATTPLDAYAPALENNLTAIVAMCAAAVPAMRERRWGRIVAITSLSVRQPMAELILSNTARAGVTAFLKTLALEVADEGITVNTVQPGMHRTSRLTSLYDGAVLDSMRLGDADDFGAHVAFLCSEQSRFTTGVQLHIDGGAYRALL